MSDIGTRIGKSITALIVTGLVFVGGVIWAFASPVLPVEPRVIWQASSGEKPRADFRFAEFPRDSAATLYSSDDALVGVLDRALCDTLEELAQSRVQVPQGSGDIAWAKRTDLCLSTDSQKMDALIANWHTSLEARRPVTRGEQTWIKYKPANEGVTAFEIQMADDEETYRWRYEVRGSNAVPLEFAWKSKRDDYLNPKSAVGSRLGITCVAAPIIGVVSYRWPRGRRTKRQ